MRLVLAAVGAAVAVTGAAAAPPTLTASLDTARVSLGDPFHLRLRVEREGDSRTLFPDLEEAVQPLRLREVRPTSTASVPGADRQVDERVYELAAFQLDVEGVPAVAVAVVTAAGDTTHLRSAPLEVEVVPVRQVEGDDELRAIKPPLAIPGGLPLWLVGIGAALLAVAVALLARFLWLRRPPEAAPAPPPRAPADYEREFARIAEMGLLERGARKLYYTRLAEVMRRFLEDVVGIAALERTTEEIAADLGRRVAQEVAASGSAASPAAGPEPVPLTDDLAARVVAFLEAADLVKFARAEPPEAEARQAPDEGRAIVAAALAARRSASVAAAADETAVPTTATA